jgi:hypothetical protein
MLSCLGDSVPADFPEIPTQSSLCGFLRRRAGLEAIEGFEVQGEQFVSCQGSVAHGSFLVLCISAAVIAAFFLSQLPRVGLEGRKGTPEESIVDYVGFAVLALHNPVALRHVAKSRVGGNSFGVFALGGVYE